MDSALSMSMLFKLVQIFVIVPLSVAFIIFNRLSRTKHWAWDLFWGVYAANRIVLYYLSLYFSKGEDLFLWLFLNGLMLALEAVSLISLSRFYSSHIKFRKVYYYLFFFSILFLNSLGYFMPKTTPGYNFFGPLYGQYLSLFILGIIMLFFGITLVRRFTTSSRPGCVIGWVIILSGISTSFSLITKLLPALAPVQLVFNVFLVVSLFVTYLLFRIEIEIRKRNELEILYDSVSKNISNVAMLRFAENGSKIYADPLATKFIEEVTDLYEFEEIFKEPEKLRSRIADALRTMKVSFLNVEIGQKEFVCYIYPGKFSGENIIDIVLLDSPELKAIENKLKNEIEELRQKIDQQLTFFANMVHELKSPLTIIKGYTEMLESSATVDQEKMLLAIHQAVNYQLGLINNLLEISKLQANKSELKIEKVDLPELITDVTYQFTDISARKGIKLEIEENKLPEEFYTDSSKLKRILINLLDNAFKFTREGKIKLSAYLHNGGVYFEVKDTGIGIKEEFLDKIFDRYSMAKGTMNRELNPSGTGIGLYLTKELVELLGGKIRLNSEYGKGTTVSFTISNMKT